MNGKLREKIHYVIYGNERKPEEDRIITFDTLELRNMIMNSDIQEGKVHDKL